MQKHKTASHRPKVNRKHADRGLVPHQVPMSRTAPHSLATGKTLLNSAQMNTQFGSQGAPMTVGTG